jgi:hypothetical protein
MPAMRVASRRGSHNDSSSDDSLSRGDDQFVIEPCLRRETRKSTHQGEASSSQAADEAVDMAKGHAVREARASGLTEKVERPLQADYEYTLRRVDHRYPQRATYYTRGENQSMINRNDDLYEWTTELHDHRFWSHFQADWYLSIIKDQKNPITTQLYVDWSYMQQKCDSVFNKVIAKAQTLGVFDMLGIYQDWKTELVAQFCSTAWRSGNGYESTIDFSIEDHRFSLYVTEFPTIFGLAPNDLHMPKVITERTIAENELAPLYYPGNEHNYGKAHGLLPEYAIFNNIFRNTFTPKRGDRTSICGSIRNLLLSILDSQPPPCINTFL